MKFLSRVVWSEGMHLGPHHFQTQSRYFEDTLWFLASNLRQHPWGLLHISIDNEAVRNGVATLDFASGILPDGLIFDIPDSDCTPAPAHLKELFADIESEILLYLAIPKRQDRDVNTSGVKALGSGISASAQSDGNRSRYRAADFTLRDDATGNDESSVALGQKNLALLSHAQLTADTISFPIARIFRDGNGGFICDPEFIAPSLRIGASDGLLLLLHRLLQAIDEKVTAVRTDRRNLGPLDLGTSALDVANYWFLHSLCSAVPALRHHLQSRRSHPEDVYLDLVRLAGALSTFAVEDTSKEIPSYDHSNLSNTFRKLDALIRHYLEIVVPSNTVTLRFQKTEPYTSAADVIDERCLRRSRWIFGVSSTIGDSALLRMVPNLVKVCSGKGVAKLIQLALPGLELTHLPVPPSALRAQADMHYFSISQAGPCWQHILQSKKVGVYIPGDLGDTAFEVTVITEIS